MTRGQLGSKRHTETSERADRASSRTGLVLQPPRSAIVLRTTSDSARRPLAQPSRARAAAVLERATARAPDRRMSGSKAECR